MDIIITNIISILSGWIGLSSLTDLVAVRNTIFNMRIIEKLRDTPDLVLQVYIKLQQLRDRVASNIIQRNSSRDFVITLSGILGEIEAEFPNHNYRSIDVHYHPP